MTKIKSVKKNGTYYSVVINDHAQYFVYADGACIYGPALRTTCIEQLAQLTKGA